MKKEFILQLIAFIISFLIIIFTSGCFKNQDNNQALISVDSGNYNTDKISSEAGGEEEWLEDYYVEPGDFAMIAVPDIQELTAYYPDKLIKMMQWIALNKEKENIKFVIGLGDVTLHGYGGTTSNDAVTEFARAAEAFKIIEDAGIYYSNAYGNRDYVSTSPRDTTLFNSYFPWSEFRKWPCYGGSIAENSSDDMYYCFTADDIKYMVIALEYNPGTAVLEWADEVVRQHPDYNIIVSTHSYLGMDGNRFDSAAERMWSDFVSKHKNIFLVLCGHVTNDKDIGSPVYSTDYGENGNKVNQLLINAQDLDSERNGVGMLMIMRFTDGGKTINFNYYSPVQGASFKKENQFSIAVD